MRVDERGAGFLALGLAVESGLPVAVITTSGTAVANLHPAVLEASHAGVPVVAVTATRPAELLGVGANQATVQSGIFGSAVRAAWDVPAPVEAGAARADGAAVAAEVLARAAASPGPLHVDVAFREPLSDALPIPPVEPGSWAPADPREPVSLEPDAATVVVAGSGAGSRAEELARELGAPLLAEVASGARFGPNLVPAYRALLRDPAFVDAIRRVVVVGHPTLAREVPALLQRPDVEALVVRGVGRDAFDPGRRARVVPAIRVVGSPLPESRGWVGPWVFASRELLATTEESATSLTDDPVERAAFGRAQVARLREPVTRRMLVEAVWAISWPHDRLVLGASRLIREADAWVPGKRIPVHANRGLAGIDGTIATASGSRARRLRAV